MRRKRKKRIWAGIDPGKSGAMAILDHSHHLVFMDWPKDNNLHYVAGQVEAWTRKYDFKMCLLEKVSSHPGQGVRSVFTFGTNYGVWQGILATLNIPHVLRTPIQWQKGLFTPTDGKDPKQRALTVCCRMFKDSSLFYGPRGGVKDGRADAALMAYKAMQIYRGKE